MPRRAGAWRRAGALARRAGLDADLGRLRALASIVETLLLTRHMLFLGFSLDDPNFLRRVDTVHRAA